MSRCEECWFYTLRTESCDFFLLTGRRRGSKAEECREFKPLEGGRRPPVKPTVMPAIPPPLRGTSLYTREALTQGSLKTRRKRR